MGIRGVPVQSRMLELLEGRPAKSGARFLLECAMLFLGVVAAVFLFLVFSYVLHPKAKPVATEQSAPAPTGNLDSVGVYRP